jgi:hypothetical protein
LNVFSRQNARSSPVEFLALLTAACARISALHKRKKYSRGLAYAGNTATAKLIDATQYSLKFQRQNERGRH